MSIDKKKLEKEIDVEKLMKKLETKSSAIRFLDQEGYNRSEIAFILGIRYQHVRNVLITPLKKS